MTRLKVNRKEYAILGILIALRIQFNVRNVLTQILVVVHTQAVVGQMLIMIAQKWMVAMNLVNASASLDFIGAMEDVIIIVTAILMLQDAATKVLVS